MRTESVASRPKGALARTIETERGTEVRCPKHGHLLGIFVAPGVLTIKCREEIVEVRFEPPLRSS